MKKVLKIDTDGYFIEDVILQDNEEFPGGWISVKCPEGFYHPRWDGEKWIEGLTQEEIDELNKPPKEQEIIRLKKQLEETDYQIIKSSEYQLLGIELPYNLEELHTERQVLRDRINELESL